MTKQWNIGYQKVTKEPEKKNTKRWLKKKVNDLPQFCLLLFPHPFAARWNKRGKPRQKLHSKLFDGLETGFNIGAAIENNEVGGV